MRVEITRLDRDLPLPSAPLEGDAGVDLFARCPIELEAKGGRGLCPTGIAIAIPEGYVGLISPRSGIAAEAGITVLNAPGVIDSGYRGEIAVILVNTGREDYAVSRGDRVAQLVVVACANLEWIETPELPDAERGSRGLGHTGR